MNEIPAASKGHTPHSADEVLDHPELISRRGLLLQPAVYAAVCFLLLLLFPGIPLFARLLLIAGVLMTLRRWGAVVVLLLVQCDLFFREGHQFPPLHGADGLFLAFVTVAVLMFSSRQRLLLTHLAGRSVTELFRRWMGRESESTAAAADPRENMFQRRSVPHVETTTQSVLDRMASACQDAGVAVLEFIPAALRGLALILVCVTAARYLLSRIPRNSELTGQLRNVVNEDPTLAAGGLILMTLLVLWIIIGEVSWRQLTPAQARVYLRSEILRETYSDLRMFVLRRIRRRQKRFLATRNAAGKPNTVGLNNGSKK